MNQKIKNNDQKTGLMGGRYIIYTSRYIYWRMASEDELNDSELVRVKFTLTELFHNSPPPKLRVIIIDDGLAKIKKILKASNAILEFGDNLVNIHLLNNNNIKIMELRLNLEGPNPLCLPVYDQLPSKSDDETEGFDLFNLSVSANFVPKNNRLVTCGPYNSGFWLTEEGASQKTIEDIISQKTGCGVMPYLLRR
jgi:hypothetical protein